MLFYLKYISHDAEKLQDLLIYFFDKVEEINPTTFDKKSLLPDWYINADNKMRELENKLRDFIAFPKDVKKRIIEAFKNANNIELLFSDKTHRIPNKSDFNTDVWKKEKNKKGEEVNIMVSAFLKELFADFLYEGQLGNKASTFSKIIQSSLSEHYDKFKREANYEDVEYLVCPFCGLEKIGSLTNIVVIRK